MMRRVASHPEPLTSGTGHCHQSYPTSQHLAGLYTSNSATAAKNKSGPPFNTSGKLTKTARCMMRCVLQHMPCRMMHDANYNHSCPCVRPESMHVFQHTAAPGCSVSHHPPVQTSNTPFIITAVDHHAAAAAPLSFLLALRRQKLARTRLPCTSRLSSSATAFSAASRPIQQVVRQNTHTRLPCTASTTHTFSQPHQHGKSCHRVPIKQQLKPPSC